MATVKTTYVSEYVHRTSKAVGPSKALEKQLIALEKQAIKTERELEQLLPLPLLVTLPRAGSVGGARTPGA